MLKKILLLHLMVGTLMVSAQDIKIINPGSSNAVNGSYVSVVSSESNPDIYKSFWVVNQTATTKTIKVRRVEVTFVNGTDNATCWDVCPPPMDAGSQTDWTSPNTQDVMANDTNKTFSAHLYPEGITGCSHYRYYWFFDDNSYTDSVDVYFSHGEVCQGIASTESLGASDQPNVSVYPNPSNGEITLDLTIENVNQYKVSVVNVVGQTVVTLDRLTSGVNQYNWSHLNPGLYFVVLSKGDKTVLTKKIQIAQ